jgi:hypothetical protein
MGCDTASLAAAWAAAPYLAVAVVHGQHDLLEVPACLVLRQLDAALHVVEEAAAVGVPAGVAAEG